MTNSRNEFANIDRDTQDRSHLLADIISKLRKAIPEERVLETGVECLRQAIGCDRVVVYCLQPDAKGQIVAESVAVGYPPTIGTTIIDPCFDARYIDKYQRGRVRAIDNIYQAGMTPCYVENLAKISVRASLVVPLMSAPDRLYGLLVLHQCNGPRTWVQKEIDLALQVAAQIGFMLEQIAQQQEYQRLSAELDRARAWQEMLPQINQTIHRGRNRLEVLQLTVEQAQKLLKCDRVVVYSLNAQSKGRIVAEVHHPSLAPILGRTIVDPCFDHRYAASYQHGRVRAIDDIHQAGMSPCYVETLASIGVKSNLVVPIVLHNGKLLGLLVAHQCFEFRQWPPSELEWARQIALQCGLALHNARMQEKQAALYGAIDSLVTANEEMQALINNTNELEQIAGEIRNLSRLLEQEVINSTQKSPAEAQQLLQIIAKRLQRNATKYQDALDRTLPNQQQLSAILTDALKVLAKSKI